jgi:hypothetical protein
MRGLIAAKGLAPAWRGTAGGARSQWRISIELHEPAIERLDWARIISRKQVAELINLARSTRRTASPSGKSVKKLAETPIRDKAAIHHEAQ